MHRRGFTLAELLVVVGIISVLMGLVLSGVGAARRGAGRVACLSNLRQIGMACQLCLDDTGRLPAEGNKGNQNPETSPAWFYVLPRYLDSSGPKGQRTVFQCPLFTWDGPQIFSDASPKSYKMNGRLDDQGRPKHYRPGTVDDEHRIVLFADAVAGETGMGQWGHLVPSGLDTQRHRGHACCLMLDGSTVCTQRPEEIRWISEQWK